MVNEAESEIVVSPAMIIAGVRAFCSQRGDDDLSETVELVYRAMETARLAAKEENEGHE